MTAVYQGTAGSSHQNSPPSRGGAFLKFADLDDLQVVVIHTGEQASRDAGIRTTLQRAHNEAVATDNPIDPEVEPEQALYVGPAQLDEGARLYKMADRDATKRVIVHLFGNLAPEKAKRLIVALRMQAPKAELYRGNQGQNAEPWQLVDVVDFEQTLAADTPSDEVPWSDNVAPLHLVKGHPEGGPELPAGFEVRGSRLCALTMVGRGEDARQEWVPIASPVHVLAETADEHGRGYGRLLEWRDSAGRVRQWAMPVRSLVPRNGEEVFAALLDAGLPFIELGYKRKLAAYLMSCQPKRRIICVERTGWHGKAYVLPGGAIGPDAEKVILQTAGYTASDFTERGTLAGWQQGVAGLAMGNSRLCFALSLAFAAPLLSLVGMEGGGFHLKGESTDGKTTVMKAAASVYGHPDRYAQTWRATGNAIEGIASRRNDALLCLDELGELDGREAGQTAYMLANGQGKGRSKQDGELRERKAWRLLFLSTGELSLEDHAASAGKSTQAGMEVRTIQIPSDTGHHGAFEWLHGMENGRTFADTLKANAEAHHGIAFRTYAQALTQAMDEHSEQLRAEIKQLAAELTPKGAGNQVSRAINRFALVAAAGEMATKLGVTGWPEGEANRAVRVCLTAWLTERGHLGNQEDVAILRQICQFFSAHQFTRFADWFDSSHRPANMVGFRKVEQEGVSFFVLPQGWLEITKGRDPKRAALLCLGAGFLLIGKDKKRLQRQVRLPGMGKGIRLYVLGERVLGAEEDDLDDE
jgi:putative DNA primase/helicase